MSEPSEEYKRGYGKGYYAAANSRWHEGKPPFPPESAVRALMKAALDLRAKVDEDYNALFLPDDPFNLAITPYLRQVDDAFSEISRWLKDQI